MANNIELTLIHSEAKTRGVDAVFLAASVNEWKSKTDEELKKLVLAHVDKSKYRDAYVWANDMKILRFFEVGYTPTDQLDGLIELKAKETGSNIVSFYVLFDFIKKIFSAHNLTQRDRDFWRTVFHNLNTKWLATNEDRNYWTQYLTEDNEDYSKFKMPVLPSSASRIFKAGFDPNAPID